MSKVKDSNYYIDWLENSINERLLTYYDYEEFKIKQHIGRGSFGRVDCATWKNADVVFALKSFNNTDGITLKKVVNEVINLKLLDL